MKKYEFTGETINHFGGKLNRIRRLSDGLIGGWIEKEENLSHEGDCFVYNNAVVCNNATVRDNAEVYDNVMVRDNAKVFDNAVLSDNVMVCNNAVVRDNAMMFNYAIVYDNVVVRDNAEIYNYATVYDNAVVRDNAVLRNNAVVRNNAKVRDNAVVCDDAVVRNNAEVYGNAKVKDSDKILGEIQIPYNKIEFYQGSNTRMITAIKTLEDRWLFNVGCQKLITKEDFIDRIYNTEGGLEENPHREFYLKILKMF